MKKILVFMVSVMLAFDTYAAEIDADNLNLTAEQNQKLAELKHNLQAEIQPILEEMESSRSRITEIEKKYFEEFWNMLSEEQHAKFIELKK